MHYRFPATNPAENWESERERVLIVSRPRLRLAFSDVLSSPTAGVRKVADLLRPSLHSLSASLPRATTEFWRLNTNTLLLSPGRDADKLHADPPWSPRTLARDHANERRSGRSLAHLAEGFDELLRMLETQDEVVSCVNLGVSSQALSKSLSPFLVPATARVLRLHLFGPDLLSSGQR